MRSWEGKPSEPVPPWLGLALAGYVAWTRGPLGDRVAVGPPATAAWFSRWARARGLSTYRDMGLAFGHTRHTVCKWMKSGPPGWLTLACLGYEAARPRPVVRCASPSDLGISKDRA